jgi:hypothetical protein
MKFKRGDLVYCNWQWLTGLGEVTEVFNTSDSVGMQCLYGSQHHGIVFYLNELHVTKLNEI